MNNYILGIISGISICVLWKIILPYITLISEILGICYRYNINKSK